MIVVCRNCNKKYQVDSESLDLGRKVRCVSCGFVWFQTMDNQDTDTYSVPPLSQPSGASQRLHIVPPAPFFGPSPAPPSHRLPPRSVPHNPFSALWSPYRIFLILGTLATLATAGIVWFFQAPLLSAYILGRDQIAHIAAWISASPPAVTPSHFRIDNLELTLSDASDKIPVRMLHLKGQVTNTSTIAHNLPPLTIIFWGADNSKEKPQALEETTRHLPLQKLLPQERVTFYFDFPLVHKGLLSLSLRIQDK